MIRPARSSSRKCSHVAHRPTRFALAIKTRGADACVRNTPTGLPLCTRSVSSFSRVVRLATIASKARQFRAALPVPPYTTRSSQRSATSGSRLFISIRSAASCGHPLHEMAVPRGARMGAMGRSAGEAISVTLARGAVEYNGDATVRPIFTALIAAAAFGLSAPLSKLLLDVVSPLFLAGLPYPGAGLFRGLARLVGRGRPTAGRPRAPRDRRILAAVVLVGGVLAPPLLLWGLARSPATTTALLLNLEVVFTALLAGVVFGEHLGPRVAMAAAVMALGGIALGWTSGGPEITAAAGAVALACLLWALDNNLTRLIAASDPLLIVDVKGLVAGSVNTLLAVLSREPWPAPGTVGLGMALGAVSYGPSLVLFILAMRNLGAARAGAHFPAAPFFGP